MEVQIIAPWALGNLVSLIAKKKAGKSRRRKKIWDPPQKKTKNERMSTLQRDHILKGKTGLRVPSFLRAKTRW